MKRFLPLFLFIVMPLAGFAATAMDELHAFLATLQSEQTMGEETASKLKSLQGAGTINVSQFEEGRLRYVKASAAFNELVARLAGSLAQGTLERTSRENNAVLKQAISLNKEFQAYVNGIQTSKGPIGGGMAELIVPIIPKLLEVGGNWWFGERDKERNALISQIEARRWKPFADIKTFALPPQRSAATPQPGSSIRPLGSFQDVQKKTKPQ